METDQCGLGRREMTATKILLAAGAICSIILVAAGASLRDARHDAPQPGAHDIRNHFSNDEFSKNDFATRWMSRGKGDRLPLSGSLPLAAANAEPEVAAPVAPKPEQQLKLATDDDLRQADEEHHRHRDICARGRIWFTIANHRYWRCKM
jgi:hypothetical protein